MRGQRSSAGEGGRKEERLGEKMGKHGKKSKSGRKGVIGERKVGTWEGEREGGRRAEGKIERRKKGRKME